MPSFLENSAAFSQENLRGVVQQWDLTWRELSELRELQARLEDINHWKKEDPYELARYLFHFDRNVNRAERNVRKTVAWRRSKNLDSYEADKTEFTAVFDKNFPSVVLKGCDKQGDPIVLERIGQVDWHGLKQTYKKKQLKHLLTVHRETLLSRNPNKLGWQQTYYEPTYGRRVKYLTIVFDFDGLDTRHVDLFHVLKHMLRVCHKRYLGMVKQMILLRVPKTFRALWKIMKHSVDVDIRDMMVFSDNDNYLEVLDEYVDREVMPSMICPDEGKGSPMPEFAHVNLQGGPIVTTADCGEKKDKKQTAEVLDETSVISWAEDASSCCFSRHSFSGTMTDLGVILEDQQQEFDELLRKEKRSNVGGNLLLGGKWTSKLGVLIED